MKPVVKSEMVQMVRKVLDEARVYKENRVRKKRLYLYGVSAGKLQRQLVFIGLSPNKIWEALYLVSSAFPESNFTFKYINRRHHFRPFFESVFYNNI
jgi:hypothetical protein